MFARDRGSFEGPIEQLNGVVGSRLHNSIWGTDRGGKERVQFFQLGRGGSDVLLSFIGEAESPTVYIFVFSHAE
jgi:hypothetical protein